MFSVVHHSAPINRPREGFLTCAVATHRLVPLGSFPRLCTKSGKSDLFSLRPLRISAALCVERPINAENAEIRRGPQRKDFHLDSTFCAKPIAAALPQNSGFRLGGGQYRNAVASGRSRTYEILSKIERLYVDPTLPRYGTDRIQQ